MPSALSIRDRRLLEAAEGYLTLGLPENALESLNCVRAPQTALFEFHYLKGQIRREQLRHYDALEEFDIAFSNNPDDVSLLMAMAWCYKRTNQLPRAITSMEMAQRIAPHDALIQYNLSCYLSLAGNTHDCLRWLGRALRLDRDFRSLIDAETDFDPVRDDKDFRRLLKMFDEDPQASSDTKRSGKYDI